GRCTPAPHGSRCRRHRRSSTRSGNHRRSSPRPTWYRERLGWCRGSRPPSPVGPPWWGYPLPSWCCRRPHHRRRPAARVPRSARSSPTTFAFGSCRLLRLADLRGGSVTPPRPFVECHVSPIAVEVSIDTGVFCPASLEGRAETVGPAPIGG